MNCVQDAQNVIQYIIKLVKGVKVLLLDKHTKALLSLIINVSSILKDDVLLVEMLEGYDRREKLSHVSCIVFVRPNNMNKKILEKELGNPKYKKYFLFFSNTINDDLLESIATSDKKNVIQIVQEIFIDYFSHDDHVFTPSHNLFGLQKDNELSDFSYNNYSQAVVDNITDCIVSSLISLGKEQPFIRYKNNSKICKKIAEIVSTKISNEKIQKLFFSKRHIFKRNSGSGSSRGDGKKVEDDNRDTVLLILDRRDDSVTPLLHQWTYQAMVHELMGFGGIAFNIVKMKKKEEDGEKKEFQKVPKKKKEKKDPKLEEILFSPMNDEFLKKNLSSNWGDICIEIKRLVDKLKNKTNKKDSLHTIDDIRNFLTSVGDIRKLNRQVDEHFRIVYHIKDMIKRNDLYTISKIEQSIVVSGENHKENYKDLITFIESLSNIGKRVRKHDIIKLILLYVLRYESYSGSKINTIIKKVKSELNFTSEDLRIINGLLMYGGEDIRKSKDLFGQVKGIKGIFKRVISPLKDVENVFTQHKPFLKKIVENALKGTLSDVTYPFYSLTSKRKAKKVIVFIVGGITYAEARVVRELNNVKKGNFVVLGGTKILNSKTFLDEVKKFQNESSYSRSFSV